MPNLNILFSLVFLLSQNLISAQSPRFLYSDNSTIIIPEELVIGDDNTPTNDVPTSITYLIVGGIIIFVFIPILWFNEWREVELVKVYEEGKKMCHEVKPDAIDYTKDKEIVYCTGLSSTSETLVDPLFGIRMQEAVKMIRCVEVYQVYERAMTKGRGSGRRTDYHYDYVWSDRKIDHRHFNDQEYGSLNEAALFPFETCVFSAKDVYLGKRKLSQAQIDMMTDFQEFSPPFAFKAYFTDELKDIINDLGWVPNIIMEDNAIYFKHNSDDFTVGDICVTFGFVPCDYISLVAEQDGETFKPFNFKERWQSLQRGCRHRFSEGMNQCCLSMFCSCGICSFFKSQFNQLNSIDWIFGNQMTKEQILQSGLEEQDTMIFTIRALGMILMMLGTFMFIGPLAALTGIMDDLDETTIIKYILYSAILGLAVSLVIIGFAWLYYRKALGLSLILIGFCSFLSVISYEISLDR